MTEAGARAGPGVWWARLSHAGVKNFQFKFNFRAKWSKVSATKAREKKSKD